MDHKEVVKGTRFVETAIKNLTSLGVDIPVVLGEVGNTLGNRSSGVGLEGVLGSALWQVDFSLYTMFLVRPLPCMDLPTLTDFSLLGRSWYQYAVRC